MDRFEKEIQLVIAGIGLFQDRVHGKGIGAVIFGDIGFHFPDKTEVIFVINGGGRVNAGQVPVTALSFAKADPRMVIIPVSPADVARLGSRVYRTSGDPFKFQDAVLVGAQEGYYGECKFQIDVRTPDYVKLDRNLLKGLFGKFNPSRGDLVFSRTGELLGVMANDSYCLVIRRFDATSTFKLAQSLHAQNLTDTLAHYYVTIEQMPAELQ